MSRARSTPRAVTPALLRSLPLPRPDDSGDKEERGRVLVVGGSAETPGALLLAGIAALRAGAGKLKLATVRSVAAHVGVAVPEALVMGVDEKRGGMDPGAAAELGEVAARVDALLIGPGMTDEDAAAKLFRRMMRDVRDPTVVLDSGALAWLGADRGALHGLGGRAVITPHAGEMAKLLGMEKDEVDAAPLDVARRAAAELRCVVALKGSETFICAPDGAAYRYAAGRVGLATSGSGDALAGIVAGLAARGAEPAVAAVWGVALHGEAGNVLSRRVGQVGFLARELLDEVPRIMQRWSEAR